MKDLGILEVQLEERNQERWHHFVDNLAVVGMMEISNKRLEMVEKEEDVRF